MKSRNWMSVNIIALLFVVLTSIIQPVSAQSQLITEILKVAWNPQQQYNSVAFVAQSYSVDYSTFKQILIVRKASDMSTVVDLSPSLGGINQQVRSIDWSPDGKYLLAAISDGTIKIWNVNDPTRQLGQTIAAFQTNNKSLQEAKWSPNGKWLVTLVYGSSISIWNVSSNFSLVDTLQLNAGYFVAWSPDSTWVAITADIQVFLSHIAPDGHFIAKDMYQFTKLDQPFIVPGNPVWNATDGQLAFIDRQTNIIHIYDVAAKKEIRTLALPGPAARLAWSPDGSQFAYDDANTNVHIIDSTSGKELANYPTRSDGGVDTIAWSPDGNRLAYSGSQDAAAMVTVSKANITNTAVQVQTPLLLLSGKPLGQTN